MHPTGYSSAACASVAIASESFLLPDYGKTSPPNGLRPEVRSLTPGRALLLSYIHIHVLLPG
jgi:hypothetical protein